MSSERALSADSNLNTAIGSANRLDELGIDAYTQNGTVLVAEIAARAALAEAVTNRVRLLRELLAESVGDKPIMLSDELDDRYHIEIVRLLTSITGGRL